MYKNLLSTHYHTELNTVYPHIDQIFRHLSSYHYDAFAGLMQQAFEYVIEHSKISELLQRGSNIIKPSIFETVNISDITNYDEVKMPAIKCLHGCPPNNRYIYGTDENTMSSKKSVNECKYNKMVLKPINCINTAENCDKS
ncbi:9875_t:CDS:2 [Cetraspora pellucida]|uniref:9875_t:CDS:1 n=1 Tax=Cetraspora pellucida TaxID=1433469 RepID=A0A9N9B6X4_9GLOM|nr:9875_t:CDS:2 [Cetraspora pellucida]